MADTAEPSAASQLLSKHAAAAAAHPVTVEEVEDPDLPGYAPSAEASSSEVAPSAPEPARPAPRSAAPDTQSIEAFPELGGSKARVGAATVVPVWSAKSNTNGTANGASPPAGSPYPSAASSGVSTPAAGPALHAAPSLHIPGRNVETLFLEPQHILPRTQLKRPLADIIKDVNRKSRASITQSTIGNGKYKFEATGPQELARQALKDLVQQIGTKVSRHGSLRSCATCSG